MTSTILSLSKFSAASAMTLLVTAILTPGAARATSIVEQEFARWKLQDKCISDSIAAHPGRSVNAQAKRDTFVDKCLKRNDMPPRNHVAPEDEEQVPVAQSH